MNLSRMVLNFSSISDLSFLAWLVFVMNVSFCFCSFNSVFVCSRHQSSWSLVFSFSRLNFVHSNVVFWQMSRRHW